MDFIDKNLLGDYHDELMEQVIEPLQASDNAKVPLSQKGANGGVAELDQNGKVPTSQLPSDNVTGAAAWVAADVITVTNAATGNAIKASGKTISTSAPSSNSDDNTVPTSQAVWSAVSGIAYWESATSGITTSNNVSITGADSNNVSLSVPQSKKIKLGSATIYEGTGDDADTLVLTDAIVRMRVLSGEAYINSDKIATQKWANLHVGDSCSCGKFSGSTDTGKYLLAGFESPSNGNSGRKVSCHFTVSYADIETKGRTGEYLLTMDYSSNTVNARIDEISGTFPSDAISLYMETVDNFPAITIEKGSVLNTSNGFFTFKVLNYSDYQNGVGYNKGGFFYGGDGTSIIEGTKIC